MDLFSCHNHILAFNCTHMYTHLTFYFQLMTFQKRLNVIKCNSHFANESVCLVEWLACFNDPQKYTGRNSIPYRSNQRWWYLYLTETITFFYKGRTYLPILGGFLLFYPWDWYEMNCMCNFHLYVHRLWATRENLYPPPT